MDKVLGLFFLLDKDKVLFFGQTIDEGDGVG